MYHLYTVDILCNGLPTVDFNTLEYEHPDESGYRKLKYVHAWVWKEWSEVQRYLFEGSVLKERMSNGSFASSEALRSWLSVFNLDLSAWGQKGFRPVEALFRELEAGEAHLEMWGRDDGVPLLMRVVHVLQLKVGSPDPRLRGKFLYNTSVQTVDGTEKSVNRLMSTKLSTKKVPFDNDRFDEETRTALASILGYSVDAFFRLDPENLPSVASLERTKVSVHRVELVDHHVDVDMSPTFKGLCTLYHLYTVNVIADGLPASSFASVEVSPDRPVVKNLMRWCWCTWPQCLDMVHNRHREMDAQLDVGRAASKTKATCLRESLDAAQELKSVLSELKTQAKTKQECERLEAMAAELMQRYQDMASGIDVVRDNASRASVKKTVPPAVVSELAEKKMVASESIRLQNI